MKTMVPAFVATLLGLQSAFSATIGGPLVPGGYSYHESQIGAVTILADSFGVSGPVDSWSFYSLQLPGYQNRPITPLLFERISDTDFILRGVGTSRASGHFDGVQTYSFDAIWGEGSVSANYTFGYTTRTYVLIPENSPPLTEWFVGSGGIVASDTEPGPFYQTVDTANFTLELGQTYRIGGTQEGDAVVPLQTSSYAVSVQMSVVPEPSAMALLGAGFVGAALRRWRPIRGGVRFRFGHR